MDIYHSDRPSLQSLLKYDSLMEIPVPGFFLTDLVNNPGLGSLTLQLHHFWSAKAHLVMLLLSLGTAWDTGTPHQKQGTICALLLTTEPYRRN